MKIIIVEDEESIAKMISLNLKYVNYETTIFYDGEEAAKEIKCNHDYDLALLDIMLPGMDGFELSKIMENYNIPVIFLTAKDDVNSKVKGLRGGAEDYIVKPFEVLELLVRIEKVLERTKKFSTIINFEDIVIDTEKREVFKDGQMIYLKPKEYDLLCVLVKNKNMAISREKLLAIVWGNSFSGETRTVDVHIAQLRKKLDLKDSIKTVSKTGYRLEDGSQ